MCSLTLAGGFLLHDDGQAGRQELDEVCNECVREHISKRTHSNTQSEKSWMKFVVNALENTLVREHILTHRPKRAG